MEGAGAVPATMRRRAAVSQTCRSLSAIHSGSGLGCRWWATNSFSGQPRMNKLHSIHS
jgi:hypothetical protein